tara:strand:- start:1927 stop:2289 length:363 start_codon:yes stop_codon:yes gene_type:complete
MIDTINIGGKDRYISFGLKSISELVDHEDWGFAKLGQKMSSNPLITTPLIVYYGAKNGAERNGDVVDFTLNDVYDWIEEIGLNSPELIKLITVFTNSLVGYLDDLKGGRSKSNTEEVKKK